MDAVSMTSPSYSSQMVSSAAQKQGAVLLQLLEAVKHAEIAQAKPLVDISEVRKIDAYA
jgi:hypothetical protein